MGCCGHRRAAMRPGPTVTPTPVIRQQISTVRQQNVVQTVSPSALVSIRYLETKPVHVRGPASGRQYQFSGSKPIQAVDARDVAALLRTGFFRQS
jgi:hypothetical protein